MRISIHARQYFLAAMFLVLSSAVSAVIAAPVTGWQTDQLVANPNPGLTDADTNSPVWGTGLDRSTDASAIWASFPTINVTGDRTLTLSATVELVGSDATHEQFRFGLLNNNGSSDTAGWLGYLAQNATGAQVGDLSAKNPLGQDFATSPFGSILGDPPRALALGTAVDPENDFFFFGTYNLSLSVKPLDTGYALFASIIGVGNSFEEVWLNVPDTDPAHVPAGFNRVGFFAGAALAAEQINITNVDVSLVTAGDTNGDDLVDLTDYQAIISHMNLTGQSRANGDVTGDGRVTIADYREWKDRRSDLSGAGTGSSGTASLPFRSQVPSHV